MPDTTLEWLATVILCLMILGVRLYSDSDTVERERRRQQFRAWQRGAPKRSQHRLWLKEVRDQYRKALREADPDGPPVPLPPEFGGPAEPTRGRSWRLDRQPGP